MKRVKLFVAVLTVAVSLAGGAQAAGAGEKEEAIMLEPVVVNAEKRSQEAQNVPSSMSVFDEGDLQDMDIKDTRDLAEHVPNMEYRDFGSRRHGLLFMRGIKSLPGGQAGTGFTVDGLSYSKAYMFMGFPLFDVDRIEVLRGAQGTLYGRNTTAGVINIYTAEPGDEFSSSATAGIGNYGTREIRANVSGPLIEDTLYMGLYGMAAVEDGYTVNDVATGGEDGRYQDGKSVRLKMRYQPGDAVKSTFIVEGQRHDDGAFPLRRTERSAYVKGGVLGEDDRYHYSHDYDSTEDTTAWNLNWNSEFETGLGTLQSITGYQNYNCVEWIDADMSPFDSMVKYMKTRDKDLSQEFRLASPESGGPFQWLTGVYLFYFDGGNQVINHYGADHPTLSGQQDDFDTTLRNAGAAVFGEGTYTFFSRLDLTVGLRGEYERTQGESSRTRTNAGVSTLMSSFDKSNYYNSLLPKFALAWHFDDDVMAYGSVAKAHKVGGYNSAAAPAGSESYDEEDSWLYEVGLKSYLMERRLMVNVAGFYTSIENEQLPLFVSGSSQGYLANSGRSHRLGVELESRYRLTEAWTLRGSASWIDARFDDYEDTVNSIDYSGNQVFCVPSYTYSLGADYRDLVAQNWELFGYAGVSGVGPQYFDNANKVRQAGYALVNGRFGFQWRSLECSLWCKNLFDRYYVAYENTTAGWAEDGRPRTFGATVSYTF